MFTPLHASEAHQLRPYVFIAPMDEEEPNALADALAAACREVEAQNAAAERGDDVANVAVVGGGAPVVEPAVADSGGTTVLEQENANQSANKNGDEKKNGNGNDEGSESESESDSDEDEVREVFDNNGTASSSASRTRKVSDCDVSSCCASRSSVSRKE